MRLLFSFLALLFAGLSWAKSAVGDRVLVVLEEASEKALYSQFWADLESRKFKLFFESPKSDQLSLFRHGELAYEHLILTPPKSKGMATFSFLAQGYGPSLTPKNLLDFTNAGGNVLLGLSSDSGTPSAVNSLLLELDISLPSDRHSIVVDHFNFDSFSSPDKHDTVLIPRPSPLRAGVKNFFGGDGLLAVPKALGQTLGNTSPLLAPILRAPITAYIYNPKEEGESIEDPFATGSQLAIVSSIQARNSARFTVLGSLEMLQDKWFSASVKGADGKSVKTVNRDFAKQLTEWTFKEVGVLKVGTITHREEVSTPAQNNSAAITASDPTLYRIKNDVNFMIEVSEYSHTHYLPFSVPAGDEIQLEFTMLSPFQRLALQPTSKSANSTYFATSFTLPDQHGIFAFKVNYKRPFFTSIEEKRQVTVRHYAHDEWPRSWRISGAWPWIAGLWSVVGGFVMFVGVWLYCEPHGQSKQSASRAS